MTEFVRVRNVFEAALDRPAEGRTAFLDRECAGDPALRAEVEQLLLCDEWPGTFGPAPDANDGARACSAPGGLLGTVVGSFRLQSVLGGGGMGTVYAAEQPEPRRLVALKILSLGLGGENSVRRFRWEAEVLARLRHPGIAQVYEVGLHQNGAIQLPWFAMELVSGAQDLTAHADAARLSVRARVELLLQACDAVHHGHLHGIVHRDLKPQNVLVDRDGRVKVIDFGIARNTSGDDERAVRTEGGFVLGTLAYMSPEQIAGETVDLRTDVYSLGVIAFELLAGRRPFQLTEMSPWQAANVVQSQTAPHLRQFAPELDPDLDLVVGKALRRERDERYASVAAFADDLRAWLAARPVAARPTSAFYQVRLFARRRRAFVVALAAVIAVVAVSLVVLAMQNVELGRKERLARRVARFARDFLAESDVMQSRGADYTVREALDEAARRLDDEAFTDAGIEAELRQLVGDTYRGLALAGAAQPHLERAAELRREELGASAPPTIAAELSLVLLRREQDRIDEAQQLLDGLMHRSQALGSDDPLRLRVQHTQALLWRDAGRLAEAESLYREVAAARERVLGPDDEATLATMQSLGTLLLARAQPEQARAVLQECLDRARRGNHPAASTWQIADNLAEAWRDLGDLDRAAAAHRQSMDGFAALLGPDHALTLGCGYHLLKVLHRQGDNAALRTLAEDLLQRCERTFGPEHRRTMYVLEACGIAQMQAGETTAACERLQRGYDVQLRILGPLHPDTFVAGQNLAKAQLASGDGNAALATTTELLHHMDETDNLSPTAAAYSHLLHAQALHAANQPHDAEAAAVEAQARLEAALPAGHAWLQQATDLLAELRARPDR